MNKISRWCMVYHCDKQSQVLHDSKCPLVTRLTFYFNYISFNCIILLYLNVLIQPLIDWLIDWYCYVFCDVLNHGLQFVVHSNLGKVVKEVVEEFRRNPPVPLPPSSTTARCVLCVCRYNTNSAEHGLPVPAPVYFCYDEEPSVLWSQ